MSQARGWFGELEAVGQGRADRPSRSVQRDRQAGSSFWNSVGVDYLTLDRPADTLSGGELQRVRLATGIGSGLVGVCYVLDEPSIGLHPRDNQRLIDALRDLQEQGNTVLVVEHDEAIMRQADYLIDIGPGAGHARRPDRGRRARRPKWPPIRDSVTGRYLCGRAGDSACPPSGAASAKTRSIVARRRHDQQPQETSSARFPLAALVCVTGVSGSGKSSLVNETLARALAPPAGRARAPSRARTAACAAPARSTSWSRSTSRPSAARRAAIRPPTPACSTKSARCSPARAKRGSAATRPGRFSFNVKGGRCEECQGQGMQQIEMNFLPDLYVPCPACEGARFNRQTLEVRYRGQSIADVLDMRVDEAVEFFENFPADRRGCWPACRKSAWAT